jgi:hypothetical protein
MALRAPKNAENWNRMGTVYRKTIKGSSEIDTRAHRLAPRMRSALILVDGRRPDDDLRRMIGPQCDEALQALLRDAFIETVATVDAVAGSAPAPAPAPIPAKPPAASPAPSDLLPGVDLPTLRRDAVKDLNHQLGPLAETLAIKMERSRSAAELLPMLDTAAQLIGRLRGAKAADAFRARFITR